MKNKVANIYLYIAMLFISTLSIQSVAQVSQITEKNVSFTNGKVTLHGALILPESKNNVPVVIHLHGSGPATRDWARPNAEEFAKFGVGSLIFDKRGSGESTGSWTTSSLNDLANDALAAVNFLKSQEKIDQNKIGFWGHSQAAWVATLAASQSNDIAFMIMLAGGGASPYESEMYSYKMSMEHFGFTQTQKEKGLDLLEDYFNYLKTGKERSKLITRLENLSSGNLRPLVEQVENIVPSVENQPNWRWVATWNPMPHIEKINCPVLLMFGDSDIDQPTDLAVKKWHEGLGKGGNENVTTIIFPGADHSLRKGGHGHHSQPVDGYMEVQLGWLWKNVINVK